MPDHLDFLGNREHRPLTLPEGRGLKPMALVLGKGSSALEVAIARSDSTPNLTALRAVWKARLAGRVSPLLFVVLYNKKTALCGPAGEQPPTFTGLDQDTVERICSTALDEPDRHAAVRFLRSVLPQLEPEARVPGLRNEGLFATHELQFGVPRRKDWNAVTEKAQTVLRHRGQTLIKNLGFSIEVLPGAASILRSADTKLAVAVFLERNESPDSPQTRFSSLSAISYALAKADAENLDYVVITAGSALRLYHARTDIGPGRRGRTETFVEIHLDILPEVDAGYLWLLFRSDPDGADAPRRSWRYTSTFCLKLMPGISGCFSLLTRCGEAELSSKFLTIRPAMRPGSEHD